MDATKSWVKRLVAAIRAGESLDLTGSGSTDPSDADEWAETRTVPAEAIRAALLTRDLNPDPHGLRLSGANILGQLDLEYATVACRLDFARCRFTTALLMEGLNCPRLTLTGSHTPALDLDGAQITGTVFLDEGFTAEGGVRALGATIGGQLSLSGAKLTNPNGMALALDGAQITGDAFLDDGFTAEGRASLSYVKVTGALVGQRTPPGSLVAVGWQLGNIHGPLNVPATAISWLDTVPPDQFSVQPWHQVAAVYERQGRPSEAKRLRYAADRRVTTLSPWPSKLTRTLYRLVAGSGYYPLVAGAWLIGAALLAGTLTCWFGSVQVTTPSGPEVLNPWLYGAAVALPPVATFIPGTTYLDGPGWLSWALIALKTLGWLETAILLAGLTGLLKKT